LYSQFRKEALQPARKRSNGRLGSKEFVHLLNLQNVVTHVKAMKVKVVRYKIDVGAKVVAVNSFVAEKEEILEDVLFVHTRGRSYPLLICIKDCSGDICCFVSFLPSS
jgi:hypothetical protein